MSALRRREAAASPRRSGARPPGSAGRPLLANLAASPFVNQRPVKRFKVAAWVLGVLLAAVNLLFWGHYRNESATLRARLAETRAALDVKSKSVVEMDRELRSLGLAAQNAQVEFLNLRIAERTFPWSLLFERIALTLPDGVRLLNLTPVFTDREKPTAPRRQRDEPPPAPEDEVVALKFRGEAKSDEALYALIDAFFSSPVFANPRLYQESGDEGSSGVQFTVDVEYKPRFDQLASMNGEEATAAGAGATAEAPADVLAADETAADQSAAADDDVPNADDFERARDSADDGGDASTGSLLEQQLESLRQSEGKP